MAKSGVGELKELAQQYCLQGKRQLAAETYQKIMRLEPANPRWPQKAGEEYRTSGRSDKAIAMFQAAAQLNAQQGLTLKAITLCKLVLELDKTNQAARRLLESFAAAAQPSPPAVPELAEGPACKPQPGGRPAAAEQPGPAASAREVADWPELANLYKKESPAEPVEQIDAADLDALLEQALPPRTLPGSVAPAPPPGSSPPPAGRTLEILIDEPETAAAPLSRALAAVPPVEDIIMHLPPVPIFSSLGPLALRALVESAEIRTYAPGERLITQGEEGHSLFVLVEGEVAVFREGPPRVALKRLGEGAFFGEIALVTRMPRTATVEAVRDCQVLKISRAVFNELVQCYPDMVRVVLRYLRERLVRGLVETHPLFAPFAGAERNQLVRRFSLIEAPRGSELATEGTRAQAMYVLLCGEAESKRGAAPLAGLTAGGIVGVESLLTGQPSLVSVRTLTKCVMLKLREDTFRDVILNHPPVLAVLSDMIAEQRRKTAAVAAGEAAEPLGIPLY